MRSNPGLRMSPLTTAWGGRFETVSKCVNCPSRSRQTAGKVP